MTIDLTRIRVCEVRCASSDQFQFPELTIDELKPKEVKT